MQFILIIICQIRGIVNQMISKYKIIKNFYETMVGANLLFQNLNWMNWYYISFCMLHTKMKKVGNRQQWPGSLGKSWIVVPLQTGLNCFIFRIMHIITMINDLWIKTIPFPVKLDRKSNDSGHNFYWPKLFFTRPNRIKL